MRCVSERQPLPLDPSSIQVPASPDKECQKPEQIPDVRIRDRNGPERREDGHKEDGRDHYLKVPQRPIFLEEVRSEQVSLFYRKDMRETYEDGPDQSYVESVDSGCVILRKSR